MMTVTESMATETTDDTTSKIGEIFMIWLNYFVFKIM
jgi:hypothetical protein